MSHKPTKAMAIEASMGLKWVERYKRGGTGLGVARARDISARKDLDTTAIARLDSFFSRHELDKDKDGWHLFTEGYPSNARIEWALRGGDAGRKWSRKVLSQSDLALDADEEKVAQNLSKEDNGYSLVLEIARKRFQDLSLEDKIPEGMHLGWPFRFMSVGKVFFYKTLEDDKGEPVTYQRGNDITPTDLQDALKIFHSYKYPIRIDREHDMANPRGIVLDIFESTDAEGNPCLACLPAYSPELAQYVKECAGTLYSSPAIEWAPDKSSFIDQKTGDNMGKFRVNALAVCVDPGQAPRILDMVRLTSNKDAVIVSLSATKESIPTDNFDLFTKTNNVIEHSTAGDSNAPSNNKENYIMDPEVQTILEEHMAALAEMRDMFEVFKTEVVGRLEKIEEKVGIEPEATEEPVVTPEEAPVAESMSRENEALRKEIETLKFANLNREASDAVKALKLRKVDQELAKKAYIAEKLGKADGLGYKPFTDDFAKRTPAVAGGPTGHSESVGPTSFMGMVESLKKSGLSHADAMSKVITTNPDAFKAYQEGLNK